MTRSPRLLLPLLGAALAAGAGVARADGEAGLYIDYGNGRVETYCIAFEGESITGQELLERAGVEVNQFSGMVCAIDGVGCRHQGNFKSCHCQCEDLSNCTYWAYFVQRNDGGWVTSPLGFLSQVARDGDMHAWVWAVGTTGRAPPPPPMTFASVCGERAEPRPAATLPAPAAATAFPTAPEAPPTASAEATTTLPSEGGFTPVPTTAMMSGAGSATPTVVLPTSPARPDEEEGGVPVARLASFTTVAALLVGAIVAAALFGRRRSLRGRQ